MKIIEREIAHVGMFGPEGTTITKAHLADCAETFDGKGPITIGHKLADWMPKFGTIKAVQLQEDGKSLKAKLELNDLLAEAVDASFYEDLSVGIKKRKSDGKHYIHHLAYLGAVPPKIRDLRIFSDLGVLYCGDEEGISEFTGKEPAEKPVQDPAAKPEAPAPEKKDPAEKPKEEDVEVKEENAQLKKELADTKATILATAKDGLKKAMEGRVPKAKQALVMQLADTLDPAPSIELADEEGKKETVSGLDILRRVLESIPKAVTEGRTDLGDAEANAKPVDLKGILGKV